MDYSNLSDVLKLGEPDPELAKSLDPNAPPAKYPDLESGRKNMLEHDTHAADAMQTDAVTRSSTTVKMRDGFDSEIQIFTSTQMGPKGAPLVVIYFGGGFMFGNNLQCANYATTVARLCSAVVLLPSYRLAPEHPWPIGPNDAWDSFVWIAANANSLGADPSLGFVVGGRSAGGSLTGIIAQKSLSDEYNGPRITGTWLCMPMLLSESSVPEEDRHLWVSREQNQNAPGFNSSMVGVLMRTWKPDEMSPMFSPFNAGPNAHHGLPTTYLQVCGMDPLRDDALLYERALRQNNVETIMDVYPGVPHAVTTSHPSLPVSKKFQIDVIDRIGQLLGQKLDRGIIEQVFPW